MMLSCARNKKSKILSREIHSSLQPLNMSLKFKVTKHINYHEFTETISIILSPRISEVKIIGYEI